MTFSKNGLFYRIFCKDLIAIENSGKNFNLYKHFEIYFNSINNFRKFSIHLSKFYVLKKNIRRLQFKRKFVENL